MQDPLSSRWFDALLAPLARRQVRRPYLVVALGLVSLALCLPLAFKLKLLTRFENLLPESQASVIELQRLQRLTRSSMNAFVVLEGEQTPRLRRLADALVPALKAIGPPWVQGAEDGVHQARAFLLPRATLFPSLAQLEKLRDDVQARWDYEVGKRAGTLIDDAPPPVISAERVRREVFEQQAEGDRFPDGYFQAKDGRALIVVVRSQVAGGDLSAGRQALQRIHAAVEAVARRPEHAGLRVGYAGELVTQIAEYGAVRDDLIEVGALGSIMILGVTLLFFMRLRALWTLGLTIAIGVSWTFALTEVAIGHLNMATGFLFSIVVGNGINYGIIYMGRFFEERRHGLEPGEAVVVASRATWLPTLTAALAAAAAYGSLGVTDFRAFKHFALIGAAGMALCWAATFLVLPSALVIADRWAPFRANGHGLFARLRLHGLPYDAPLAWLVRRAPRALALGGGLLAAAGLVATVGYIRGNPMQYDARKLLNDLGGSRELARLGELSQHVLGTRIDGSMIVVCDRLDQVRGLRAVLEQKRRAAPRGEKPFDAVHTLFDFVPEDQAAKIPVALELRDLLLRARAKHFVKDRDWRELEPILPPKGLAPFGLADLPEALSRPFTDSRGLRGTIVVIEPAADQHDWDLHYLRRWADSFRETRLPDGEVIRGSGRAVIYSDMMSTVIRDIPKAVSLSIGLTVLAVVLTFRRGRHSFGVLVSLLTGIAWLGLYLAVSRTRIHFLNFVAIPITFGIGVDYAVNFFQRYASRGELGVEGVLRTTGGAVVLCSLTTMLGYIALLSSINQAIRGLGALAVAGEVTCLFAALLVAPAALVWRARRRRRAAR